VKSAQTSPAHQPVLAIAMVLVVTAFLSWIGTEIWQVRHLTTAAPTIAAVAGRSAWLQGIAMATAALVVVSGTWYLNKRLSARASALQADIDADHERFVTLSADVREIAYTGEDAGRRLTAQVGETIAAIAQITSRSVETSGRVRDLTSQVSEGASAMEQIQSAVNSLATLIASQKELVDRNSAAVDQMSASISRVAGEAEEKRTVAENLLQLTAHGKKQVVETESLIGEVGEYVATVHSMASMINSIAANTNLLAMNAAIEAAHAGSYGRGFAVVAEEIRNLAESSATNARHISQTLKQLTGKIEQARVAGTASGQAFQEIEQGVEPVVSAFQQIAAGTDQISRSSGEVLQVTGSLEQISTEISGSAEEMTYGAREVTQVLSSTRDAAVGTNEAMEAISSSAKSLNRAVLGISSLSVESNEQILAVLNALSTFDTKRSSEQNVETATEVASATERLTLANLMLKHLSWLGSVRSAIDGTATIEPATLGDPTRSELGHWLATEGMEAIPDEGVYNRLVAKHQEVHRIAGEIVTAAPATETGMSEREIESRFHELLAGSRAVVEILTSLQQAAVITWSPALAVDVSAFDNHHRKLIGLIGQLYQAMQTGQTREVLEKTFDALLDYTGYHFGAEERTFEHFGYPQCEFHKQRHRALVEQAVALRKEMESGKALVAVEVMEFLRDWITKHIKGCDKLYSDFFRNKDVDQFLRQLN
jgi:methyl-accepting chemotaxis protein